MKRKILHFLLAVLIAFGIWIYVVTVVSPESEATYYNIPVVFVNESILMDKGLMVQGEDAPTVTLQLRGNRSDLNGLKNSDITVVADLSKINEAGTQSLSCNVSFAGNAYDNPYEILNQTPSKIELEIAEWTSKEVPVNVELLGSLGMDYIAYEDEAVLDNETVTITGPKSVVDQITQARIDVDLTGRVESFSESYRFTLCNESGQPVDASSIKTNVAQVSVALRIQRVKQLTLAVNVNYGGGATSANTVITMNYESIKVAGSELLLDSLADELVIGTVDLAEIPEDTVLTFPVKLPEGLENLSGIKEVQVTVSFPELATKTFSISKILVSGTPAGMQAEVVTKLVEITVRGPKDMIDAILEENITILVDLKEAQLGDNRCKAQILVDKDFEQVGVISTYNVIVNLTESDGGLS